MTRLIVIGLLIFQLSTAQIVPIQGTDTLSSSRTVINNNFSYLDTSKAKAAVCPANQVTIATLVSGAGVTCVALSAAYLPSAVPTSVVNDTNVTGSLAANALTLGWTGLLSVGRGGTGTASPGLVAGTNVTITGAAWPNQTINSTGGGGASTFSQLLDYVVVNTSGPAQQMGASCTLCQIGQGAATSTPLTGPVTATLSGTTVGGVNQAWWYYTSTLQLTIGHNTASTITCPAPCNVATGITGFPADAIPLWNTTFTSLVWNTVTPPTMDKRAILRNNVIAAGSNMTSSIDPTTGIQTLSALTSAPPFLRYWTATNENTSGIISGNGWLTDGSTTGANVGSPLQFFGLSILKTSGAHYVTLMVRVPTGWGGAVNLKAFWTLQFSNTGLGTGTHDYALACFTPGISNFSGAPTFSAAQAITFNFTGTQYNNGQVDTPTTWTIPACSAGDIMYIRMIRESGGTAPDLSVLLYFDVQLI